MAFPYFTSTEAQPIGVAKTFAAAADLATYDSLCSLEATYNTNRTLGKYPSVLYISVAGTGNIAGFHWPLWIDINGSGSNSYDGFWPVRISVQAGAPMPNGYFVFNSASPGPQHLFRLNANVKPVAAFGGTAHGGTLKKISIEIDDTEYFLLASTAPA